MVLGFIVRYDIRIKGPRPSLCRRTLPMRKQIAKFYRWVRWISALHMCLSDSQPKERRKSKKAWPLWNRGEDQLLAKSQTSVVGRLFFFFCSRSTKWSHSITRSTKKKSDTSQIHIHTRKSSSLTSTSPLSTEPLCFTIFIISLLHVWPSFFLVFLYHISLPLTSPLLTGYGMSYTGSFSRIIICTDDDDLNLPW